jgi:hypothetical protein
MSLACHRATMNNKLVLTLSLSLLLFLPRPVTAGSVSLDQPVELSAAESHSPWHFRLAPYAWMVSTSGRVGAGPLSADAGLNSSDVLSSLRFAAMFVAEVGYGRWSFENDFIYSSFESSQRTPGPLYDKLRSTLYETIWTSYLGYRVIDTPRFTADLQGGFRLISLGLDLELTPGLLPKRSRYSSRTWVDPVIGLRTRTYVTDWLFVPLRGDIGGFGANSDLTWQAFGGLGFQITRWAALLVGYRGMGYDYDQAGFLYQVNTHGPLVGLEFKF